MTIPYKKRKIIRTKDINRDYFELVFQRENELFVPGDMLELYNVDKPSVFVASGINEPWVRLLLNRDLFEDIREQDYIKFNRDVFNPFPELRNEETVTFLIDAAGISPLLSYASSYPGAECKVFIMGTGVPNEKWVKENLTVVKKVSDIPDKEGYLVCRDENVTSLKLKKSKSVHII